MKRQSRKKRRLEYIRFKNRIRKFEPVRFAFKSSNELKQNTQDFTNIINNFISDLKRKYKLELYLVNIETGLSRHDFSRGLHTVKITLKRLKHNENRI